MDYGKIIRDIISSGLNSQSHGLDGKKAAEGLGAILPQLLDQIHKNAKEPQERASLNQALLDHGDDNIENPTQYIDNFDSQESERMVEKIFGNRQREVQEETKKRTGFSDDEVKKLLLMAAPLVIAHLAKAKKQKNVSEEELPREIEDFKSNSHGIIGILKNLMG